jgi:SAP domain
MTVLTEIPQRELKVAPFKQIKNSDGNKISVRKHLDVVIRSIKEKHHPQSRVVKEWEDFAKAFPSGTAEEYVAQAGSKYHIPFPSLFRPEKGPYLEGKKASWTSKNKSLYSEGSVLRAETTASVQWGPNMTDAGANSGFPGIGTNVSDHPRIFPDFAAQGLTGPHLLPGDPAEFRSTAYENRSVEDLKLELRRRKLKVSGKKADLVARLKDDDEKKNNNAVENLRNEIESDCSSEFEVNAENCYDTSEESGDEGIDSRKRRRNSGTAESSGDGADVTAGVAPRVAGKRGRRRQPRGESAVGSNEEGSGSASASSNDMGGPGQSTSDGADVTAGIAPRVAGKRGRRRQPRGESAAGSTAEGNAHV